jgi:predicted nuclease of predicted toxin-antitoxin system
VRVLLDECVPARLAREIPGHAVTTVRRMQWASLNDSRLLRRASEEFDVLLTVDQSIKFQQVVPPNLALITCIEVD